MGTKTDERIAAKVRNQERLLSEEHQTWLGLCELLQLLGAVTANDLRSPIADRKTEGQRLLGAIRRWGDLRVELEASLEKKR